jgi:hypothetical protein
MNRSLQHASSGADTLLDGQASRIRSVGVNGRPRTARRRGASRRAFKLDGAAFERLEPRIVPSTIQWIAAGGGDWDRAANWSGNKVPTGGDDVVINLKSGTITHSSSASDAVRGLTSNAPMTISAGKLQVGGASKVSSILTLAGGSLIDNTTLTAGTFSWAGGALSGTGKIVATHATVAGGALSLANATITPGGATGLAGDATLPLVGKVHLAGTATDASHYQLSASLTSVSLGGFTLSNDTVTVGNSGVGLAGAATLPLVGKVHMQGSLQGSHYSLTAHLGSVTIAGFGLTNDTVTFSDTGISLLGDASLPLAGKVHLTGTVQDASHFSLGAPVGNLTVDGFGLTNDAVTLSNAGLSLQGHANLPLVGTVALAATIAPGGSFSFTATHAPVTPLGGLVQLNNIQLTLTSSSLTVGAHASVAQIGQADFQGSISANGNYDLKAQASIDIAGFTIPGADLDLGTQSLGASFDLPIPVIGDVAFQGSFAAGGHWSIGATIPGPIFVGTFPLDDLHFVLSDTSLTLGARTGVQGVLDAGVTGTIYYSGLFNLVVDAHALSLGGFSLGNESITLGNSDPDHLFRMHVHATAGVPYGPSLYLDGVLDGHGTFDLKGTENVGIAGLNFSDAAFEMNNSGLVFNADWTYFFYSAHVNGSVDAHGHVIFHGVASAGFAGFTFQQMTADADLNPTTGIDSVDFDAQENVFIASVDFHAHAGRTASGWQPIVLTGTASVGGPLAPIVNGSLSFTVATNEIGFSGRLSAIDNLVSFSVRGAVYSNGTFELDGLSFNALNLVAQAAGELLHVAGEAAEEVARTLAAAYNLAAQDVALILNDIGVAASDIASAVAGVFNLSDQALAAALNDAGVAADDIAAALSSIYGDVAWVAGYWMNQAGVVGTEIARAMNDIFHDTDQAAAVALRDAGVLADDIAEGLKTFWNDADWVAGYWMNQAGVAASDIAHAVADVFNDTDQALATALHDAGVAAGDIAQALSTIYHDSDWVVGYWMNQAGVAASDIAHAVASVFNETDQALATALHYAGLAADDIAGALVSIYNDADWVAGYWMNQAGVVGTEIARAMADVFRDTDQAAAVALHDAGVLADDIAQGLGWFWNDTDQAAAYWMNQAGVAVDAIAEALKDIYNDTDQAVAYWLGEAGVAASDIANAVATAFDESVDAVESWLGGVLGDIGGFLSHLL